jgi:NAD(P)-dependent dehydrogenase (short-subunit alcohol dehydrogenase family)
MAAMVAFLFSDDATYLNGQTIRPDGSLAILSRGRGDEYVNGHSQKGQ